MTVSVTHLKPVIASGRHLTWANAADLSPRWTLLAPGSQFRDRTRCSFHLNFHAAVSQVANPSLHAKVESPSAAGGSKTHSLNATLNDQSPAFNKWLNAGGLRSGDETSGNGFCPAARAPRHGKQIVEQPAQWR